MRRNALLSPSMISGLSGLTDFISQLPEAQINAIVSPPEPKFDFANVIPITAQSSKTYRHRCNGCNNVMFEAESSCFKCRTGGGQ